ncbi:MAG TPA: P1 family peptidase, partial [bacterium]|nr:P1 family peptidase [bacterium]
MTAGAAITDVPGITVGHATDLEHLTGCTAVLCGDGAVAGGAVLGGAPGTRETDLLRPENLVERVHAVLLCGGSAFGLAAADGAVGYLEARGIGHPAPRARVPIVPAAVIYDLDIGSADIRPDAAMGAAACRAAGAGPI